MGTSTLLSKKDEYIENLSKFLLQNTVVLEKEGNQGEDTDINRKRDASMEEPQSDIVGLMISNLGEIREYFLISQRQARRSFVLACVMCAIGVILLAMAVVIAVLNPAVLTPTIVSTLGGAITLFIARTAFTLYDKTIVQLDKYYSSLHNNEQLLLAVYLVAKLSDDKRDEAYKQIIEELIKQCLATPNEKGGGIAEEGKALNG